MDFLILLAQRHESFRRAELEAIAQLLKVDLEIMEYDDLTPFCVVKLPSVAAAKQLVARSILAASVYELWGVGNTLEEVHADVRQRTQHIWHQYKNVSFRFAVHGARGKRTDSEQRSIISTFSYLGFAGRVVLKKPDHDFRLYELWPEAERQTGRQKEDSQPLRAYFGRLIGKSDRDAANKFSLKTRSYINTTSMDAELSLITANLAHAAPGRIFLDPFVGTGGFCVSAAHFGAMTIGGDIDGRTVRGKDGKSIMSNFKQYELTDLWLDAIVSDLTNTPLRLVGKRWIDGIICDPPYGIREGCKVLGSRQGPTTEVLLDGLPAHLQPGYIPPKKPYSFTALLDDILHFGAEILVDNGRLAMWMPSANDDVEFTIPQSPYLELSSECVQRFGSRRLLTYIRIPEAQTGPVMPRDKTAANGVRANDLNDFRKRYFEGFQSIKSSGL